MAASKKISSYTIGVGNKINFTFTDGTTASGVYNSKTGNKISGDADAPATFSVVGQAKVSQPTTSNIQNVSKLEPNNYVNNGAVSNDYKQQIANNVDSNKPDITACVKQRIKDIIGIFTAPFGLPTELPDIGNLPKTSLSDLFKQIGDGVKNGAIDLKNQIVGGIKGIKDAITSSIDVGDLSVSKFLGCDELAVSSANERKDLATSPIKQEQTQAAAVAKSTTSLQQKTEQKVEQKVQPVKSAQSNISTLTPVD